METMWHKVVEIAFFDVLLPILLVITLCGLAFMLYSIVKDMLDGDDVG